MLPLPIPLWLPPVPQDWLSGILTGDEINVHSTWKQRDGLTAAWETGFLSCSLAVRLLAGKDGRFAGAI